MELTLKEAEITRLNLQPGDVLTVTVKDPDVDMNNLELLRKMFIQCFPNNKVMLFGLSENSEIKFTVTSADPTPSCGTQSYCTDCSCGKKEQAEGK